MVSRHHLRTVPLWRRSLRLRPLRRSKPSFKPAPSFVTCVFSVTVINLQQDDEDDDEEEEEVSPGRNEPPSRALGGGVLEGSGTEF